MVVIKIIMIVFWTVLYSLWSWYSIKDIINTHSENELREETQWWIIVTGVLALIVTGIVFILYS